MVDGTSPRGRASLPERTKTRMILSTSMQPTTLGELRRAMAAGSIPRRSVHAEVRENLIREAPRRRGALPRHHRLRRHGGAAGGQRHPLAAQLHPARPARPGEDAAPARVDHAARRAHPRRRRARRSTMTPWRPLSAYARRRAAEEGDALPIAWRHRDERYVEKLATPDVTIADIIGDIDPIKAARGGHAALRRADDALRPAAQGEPVRLRDQRTAGPGGQDPGGPLQHPPGGRRPDQRATPCACRWT